MNSWPALDRFLQTDPRDAGCGKAMELLHIYAELAAADPGAAEHRHPEVAAHLRACGPCAEDLEGLLAAIKTDLTEQQPPTVRRRGNRDLPGDVPRTAGKTPPAAAANR